MVRELCPIALVLTVACSNLLGYDEIAFVDRDGDAGVGGTKPKLHDGGTWSDAGASGGAAGAAGASGASGANAGGTSSGGAPTGGGGAPTGGGGAPAAACGDGQCSGAETCSSCAADCGSCSPPVCPPANTFFVKPGQSIQVAMDAARACAKSSSPTWPNHTAQDAHFAKVVLEPGVHQLSTALHTRGHVRIEAPGAEVRGLPGMHLMNVDDNGGGGYGAPDVYWTIDGGVWNANGGGGFSIVHTRKFVMRNLEIKNIGYKAHHLEINSSGGEYQAGVHNVIVDKVTMHGVAAVHRIDDEAINIDYSWIGAAHNVKGDGTVSNNVLIKDSVFYDVPRAISSHHFQTSGGAPKAKMSGITILGGHFHDIDPSLAESGGAFENDGAIRPYGWQNVVISGATFERCATAISVYVPADYPAALGSLGAFVIQGNKLISCGRAKKSGATVPLITVNSSTAGVNLWDVVVKGNTVGGDWVAGSQYFVAVYDTHHCAITGNHFAPTAYSLAAEKAHNKYTAQGSTNFGTFVLSGNTVSDGTVDNS
ncbi:MAG: hypothetical protein HYZ29_26905 [Myxococcales bacterium]|nr:hypothetical protein [Myxococcales bacterium]